MSSELEIESSTSTEEENFETTNRNKKDWTVPTITKNTSCCEEKPDDK